MTAEQARKLTAEWDRYCGDNYLYEYLIERIDKAARRGLEQLPEPWSCGVWDAGYLPSQLVEDTVSQLRERGYQVAVLGQQILSVSWSPEKEQMQ